MDVVEALGFNDPSKTGGSMLTYTLWTTPPNLGEPLNIIISNESDPRVLEETMLDGGLYNYLEAAAFGNQCFGLHMGDKQQANLGDGLTNQTQHTILRYQYFRNHFLGTCLESIYGGNHIRVWKQYSSGAYFLSSSAEEDSTDNHKLGLNAYDAGRDLFVGNATNIRVQGHLEANQTFVGEVSKRGWKYRTTVRYIEDLVPANRTKWNHYTGVQAIGGYVSDGLVAVLTVQAQKDQPGLWSEEVSSALGL
ncbi:hypothetical protein I317_04433 [Kwoniella heveanensis CBS 569]|nr:hypothetical protein I317_04433 [Kwoniella heveanensis CBS 569]